MNPFILRSKTTRVSPSLCPTCGYLNDAATDMEGHTAPEPGDFCICLNCAAILKYGSTMLLEASSLDEIPEDSRAGFALAQRSAQSLLGARKVLGGVEKYVTH